MHDTLKDQSQGSIECPMLASSHCNTIDHIPQSCTDPPPASANDLLLVSNLALILSILIIHLPQSSKSVSRDHMRHSRKVAIASNRALENESLLPIPKDLQLHWKEMQPAYGPSTPPTDRPIAEGSDAAEEQESPRMANMNERKKASWCWRQV
jgi:hypothetical protein